MAEEICRLGLDFLVDGNLVAYVQLYGEFTRIDWGQMTVLDWYKSRMEIGMMSLQIYFENLKTI